MRRALIAAAVLASSAAATQAATVTLSSLGPTTYSENFNGLAKTGTGTLAAALPGWNFANTGSVAATTYTADTGTNFIGGYYSYGLANNDDRALGTIGSPLASAGSFSIGMSVAVGAGSTTLQSLTLSYTGEQWRNASNTTAQSIYFYYGYSAGLTPFNGGVQVGALEFAGPSHASTAVAIDGNANSQTLSYTFANLNLSPGQEIFLYWYDADHPGNDHGLAIDDVSVSATFASAAPPDGGTGDPSPVPLPSAALSGLVLLGCSTLRARRR